jgi:hypothetical protein
MISNAGGQKWETEGLAAEWGLGNMDLGFAETGMGLDDDASASLPPPKKEVLLKYACSVFAKANQAVGTMSEEGFHRTVQDWHEAEWKEGEIGHAVLS